MVFIKNKIIEKIMEDKGHALILAEIAKNKNVYHLPDSKNDSFQLILTAISHFETEEKICQI
jgi:hypothetical protein